MEHGLAVEGALNTYVSTIQVQGTGSKVESEVQRYRVHSIPAYPGTYMYKIHGMDNVQGALNTCISSPR